VCIECPPQLPPKINVHLETQNVIFLKIKVFIHMIEIRIEIRSYWIRVEPNPKQNILRRVRRETIREEGHVKTEIVQPKPTHQGALTIACYHQELRESHRSDLLSEPPKGANPASTLISDF
jgi:hypothetical protein